MIDNPIKEQLDKDMQEWWDQLSERRQQSQPQRPPSQITSEIMVVKNEEELKKVIAQKLRSQVSPNSGTMPSQGGY